MKNTVFSFFVAVIMMIANTSYAGDAIGGVPQTPGKGISFSPEMTRDFIIYGEIKEKLPLYASFDTVCHAQATLTGLVVVTHLIDGANEFQAFSSDKVTIDASRMEVIHKEYIHEVSASDIPKEILDSLVNSGVVKKDDGTCHLVQSTKAHPVYLDKFGNPAKFQVYKFTLQNGTSVLIPVLNSYCMNVQMVKKLPDLKGAKIVKNTAEKKKEEPQVQDEPKQEQKSDDPKSGTTATLKIDSIPSGGLLINLDIDVNQHQEMNNSGNSISESKVSGGGGAVPIDQVEIRQGGTTSWFDQVVTPSAAPISGMQSGTGQMIVQQGGQGGQQPIVIYAGTPLNLNRNGREKMSVGEVDNSWREWIKLGLFGGLAIADRVTGYGDPKVIVNNSTVIHGGGGGGGNNDGQPCTGPNGCSGTYQNGVCGCPWTGAEKRSNQGLDNSGFGNQKIMNPAVNTNRNQQTVTGAVYDF